MSATQSEIQPVGIQDPNRKIITWTLVLARAYQLYAKRFWTFFLIAIVPAIAAFAFSYFAGIVTRRLLWGGIAVFPSGKWIALSVFLGWFQGAGYWIISAFFFAAIAATIVTNTAGHVPAVSDAYTLPRKRLGPITAIALITWTLFFVGRAAAGFAVYELLHRLRLNELWISWGAFGLILLMLAGLLSKFALSVPGLMKDPGTSLRTVVKSSLQETAGWEFFFIMFLAKSAAIGYGAYWIAGRGLDWLGLHWTLGPDAYIWMARSVYISIAAIIESPLFIAFSVLYAELQTKMEGPDDSAIN